MLFWEDVITLISMLEVSLFLMSIWTFILNLSDLNIHTTIKKNYIEIMPSSIPHQNFCFYHLPTRGRAGIKLGDVQRIYNLWSIHAIILSILDVLWALLCTFILFLGLTYWPRAQCQFLFFPLFQCFAEKEYQTESKQNETFGKVIFGKKAIRETWSARQERKREPRGRGAPTP